MSQTSNNAIPKKRSAFRISPRNAQTGLALAGAVLGLLVIQFGYSDPWHLLLLVVSFGIAMTLHRTWALYLMFGMLAFVQFRFQHRGLDFPDVIYTLLAMTFGCVCFRHAELSKYIRAFYPETDGGEGGGSIKYQFPSLFGGRWWTIPIAVFLAVVLLGVFPMDRFSVNRYWIKPYASRTMFLFTFLFFTWMLLRSLFGVIRRWGMTKAQGDIHIRSIIANEFWWEHSAIEKRKAKQQSTMGDSI